MASPLRQIFAFSGVLDSADEEGSFALVEHALGLSARADPDHRGPGHMEPDRGGPDHGGPDHGGPDHGGPDGHQSTRVCYIPTAVGDAQAAIDFYADRFAGRPDARLSVLRLFTQPSVPDVAAHLFGQDLILVEGAAW